MSVHKPYLAQCVTDAGATALQRELSWKRHADDARDARLMALFAEARVQRWRSKRTPCHIERAFVGIE